MSLYTFICYLRFLIYQLIRHGEMYKGVETCNPKEKFAILVHGWRESCDVKWMEFLVSSECKTNIV